MRLGKLYKRVKNSYKLNRLKRLIFPISTGPALSESKKPDAFIPKTNLGQRLKVALCFSGQIRNLDRGYQYIEKNVIKPNVTDCDIDVFMHLYFGQEEIGKTFVAANGTLVNSVVTPTALMDIYKYYNPQKILVEKPINFDEKNYRQRKPDAIIPLYSLRKNFSLKRSIELKREYEVQNDFVYDYVMTLRTDLGINSERLFKNFDPDAVSCSEGGFFEGKGVDVTHAVLGGKLADKYGEFFDYMDQYYNEGMQFCDEPMMHRHLDFHHIPFVRVAGMNDYTLLRN